LDIDGRRKHIRLPDGNWALGWYRSRSPKDGIALATAIFYFAESNPSNHNGYYQKHEASYNEKLEPSGRSLNPPRKAEAMRDVAIFIERRKLISGWSCLNQ
jgi:hypothetical protein